MISEARKNGIRLVLTLSNNYQDFGGRPQYVNWARSAGVPVSNDDDFYTNAIIKGYYKNHVKVYINKYIYMHVQIINTKACNIAKFSASYKLFLWLRE